MWFTALLLLLAALPGNGASTARVVVPDMAGMVHPPTSSALHVRFGDLGAQYPMAYEFVASSTDSIDCTGARLCLGLKFSSAFDMDPFFLRQYDANYPLVSATFDAHDPTSILPIIPGNSESIVWWFQTNATATDSSTGGPVVDLLLRLRQISQRFAARDQFLVVVRVALTDERTATSSMEGYNVYGNQRVTQTTHRLDVKTIQMQLSITRNSQKSDVVPLDAYPLLSTASGDDSSSLGDSCDACDAFLDTCQSVEPCQTVVLPCLISQLKTLPTASLQSTSGSGNMEAGDAGSVSDADLFGSNVSEEESTTATSSATSQVDLLIPLATCVGSLPTATWAPVRQLIFCLARSKCALGTAPDATTGEEISTILRLTNGTQTFAVTPTTSGTDNVELTIKMRDIRSSIVDPKTYSYSASASYLGMFLRSFVLLQTAQVSVEVEPYTTDPSLLQLKLEYSDALMFQSLVFSTSSGSITTIESSPARLLIEYPSSSTYPELDMLISKLESRLKPVAATGEPWILADECLTCSSKFFGCSSEDIAKYSCSYDSIASGFGRCIREQLPSKVYEGLMAGAKDQIPVGTEVTRCLSAISSGTDTLTLLLGASSGLACFAATRCPFGPISLVEDTKAIVLETSSYVQLVRVLSSSSIDTVSIQVQFTVDGILFVTASPIEASSFESDIQHLLDNTLQATGITTEVSSSVDNNAGSEWTLEIIYHHVFLPSTFTAEAVNNDASVTTVSIRQLMLEGGAFQLRVVPRDATQIFKATDAGVDSDSFSAASSTSDSGSDYL